MQVMDIKIYAIDGQIYFPVLSAEKVPKLVCCEVGLKLFARYRGLAPSEIPPLRGSQFPFPPGALAPIS